MKKISIEILCDEFYVADSLRELALRYEDEDLFDSEYADEDGEVESDEVYYEDGTGSMVFDTDNYTVVWNDDEEDRGDGMIFQ